jgi:hypothetical protein
MIGRLLAISVLSTLTMDVGFVLGQKLRITGPTPGKFAPRWISSCLRGRFLHADIATVAAFPAEIPVFVVAHHAIGLVLTAAYLLAVGPTGLASNIAVGVVYGIATSVFAWLLMFPAMGFGAFGLRAPKDNTPLRTTAFNHAMFGLGLAVWSKVLS